MSAPTFPTDAQIPPVRHHRRGVGGPNPCAAQDTWDSHLIHGSAGPNSVGAHRREDSHIPAGVDGSTSAGDPNVTGQPYYDRSPAEPLTPLAAPIAHGSANLSGEPLVDPFLALAADMVDDLEKVRIANENRLRQLTRTGADEDGIERGFGLDESNRDVARVAALVAALGTSEKQAAATLTARMRKSPFAAFAARNPGVGEKQLARLLAAIGDPAVKTSSGEWATVRDLYSYCGYGDASRQVRRRGQPNSWNADAKMRVHLIVESCVKSLRAPCSRPDGQSWAVHRDGCRCSAYRVVYDEGRAKYADTVHPAECKRCGPAGAPAEAGSALSNGHQEARAYRLAGKALLRDLWREARRLHGFDDEEMAA